MPGGRKRINIVWQNLIYQMRASGSDAKEIKVACDKATFHKDAGKSPSIKTIGRYMSEYDALPIKEQENYRLFHWPFHMGSDDLPWTASSRLLALVRYLDENDHPRPTVRVAKWFWRVALTQNWDYLILEEIAQNLRQTSDPIERRKLEKDFMGYESLRTYTLIFWAEIFAAHELMNNGIGQDEVWQAMEYYLAYFPGYDWEDAHLRYNNRLKQSEGESTNQWPPHIRQGNPIPSMEYATQLLRDKGVMSEEALDQLSHTLSGHY
jgi:hypothetical protein